MRDVERRALEHIDFKGLLGFLCDFIAVPSLGGEERPAQEFMAGRLGELGFGVETWEMDFDELRGHPSFSMVVEREEGLGVLGTIGGDRGGRSLILNGHVDVVPIGDESNWSRPPWRGTVAEDRVYGRGAVDMKGGIACALYAAKAVLDSGVELAGELVFNTTIGEEDGGVGALDAVLHGMRADAAVVMEPSETLIVPAHAGACCFRITVPGKSAHACVREEGVDAIEKFYPVMRALRGLEEERNKEVDDPLYSRYRLPFAINLGRVRGGEWPGSVAESMVCEGRIGVAVDESIDHARRSLERAVAEVAERDPWLRGHPPKVEWWGYQYAPSKTPVGHPIIETVKGACGEVTGRTPGVEGATYASDMRHLVNVGGIPTVIFGPGDVRNSHQPDEYVPIEDLKTVTRALTLTILRFCGYRE